VYWQVWVNLRAGQRTRLSVSVPAGLDRLRSGGWFRFSANDRGEIPAKVSVFSGPLDESFAAVLPGVTLGRLAMARQGQQSC
jgi:hypothetical protein